MSEGSHIQARLRWVLVVEDDPVISEILLETLKHEGFRTVHSESVSEAIVKLSRQDFDCVVLDVQLKTESGEKVTRYLRSGDYKKKNTPILLISGNLEGSLLEKLAPQINGALLKPFKMQIFVDRVKALIKQGLPGLGVGNRVA